MLSGASGGVGANGLPPVMVTLVEPAAVFPDTNAHFRGEDPQYVYTVRFESGELWGADAEPFAVTIEMFESYLEAA